MHLYPTNTSVLSTTEIWIWANQMANIRNNPNGPNVTWGSANLTLPRLVNVPRAAVISAVNKRLGRLCKVGKSYYIALPISALTTPPVQQQVPTSPATVVKKTRKSKLAPTSYTVLKTTDKKFAIEATKGQKKKVISKKFTTEQEAVSYIRGALRRPTFGKI